MFSEFYGLRGQPFGVSPTMKYFYASSAHTEALSSLIYGVECDLGFTALIADAGMGKTTLLLYLLERFRYSAKTALLFNTQCSSQELLRYLAAELGIDAWGDPVALHESFKEALAQEALNDRRVLLIIDEAHNLDENVLETVRLLSDYETPESKLIHIVLSGQPALAGKLAQPAMQQLMQRIALVGRLPRFDFNETLSYIAHHLQAAGHRGDGIFTLDALEAVAHESQGIPRQINRICFQALTAGCALQKRTIDANIIQDIVGDFSIEAICSRSTCLSKESSRAYAAAQVSRSHANEEMQQAAASAFTSSTTHGNGKGTTSSLLRSQDRNRAHAEVNSRNPTQLSSNIHAELSNTRLQQSGNPAEKRTVKQLNDESPYWTMRMIAFAVLFAAIVFGILAAWFRRMDLPKHPTPITTSQLRIVSPAITDRAAQPRGANPC